MVKPKRMSEIFTSSSDKNAPIALPTATPPYSSEGPTLPIVGSTKKQKNPITDTKARKERKTINQNLSTAQPPSVHSSLYTPWTLLPAELLKRLQPQDRLRDLQNIVPVVFTKNQNVKAGVNRLKMLLGASPNTASTIETRDAMNQKDMVIAVSAQGQGTIKLVGIVDIARRVVAPEKPHEEAGTKTDTWWMYTTLTSILVERQKKHKGEEVEDTQETEEEEAFGPMDIDGQEETNKKGTEMRKDPVLTVWMTKKRIPELGDAFGEQSFQVQSVQD